ncbi:MAG: hypothetical protein LBF54_01135 [Holosporaceae bacterium]|jgi:hypothetical protein|nr:hypothetical protein [Holosporaceae bacterium]
MSKYLEYMARIRNLRSALIPVASFCVAFFCFSENVFALNVVSTTNAVLRRSVGFRLLSEGRDLSGLSKDAQEIASITLCEDPEKFTGLFCQVFDGNEVGKTCVAEIAKVFRSGMKLAPIIVCTNPETFANNVPLLSEIRKRILSGEEPGNFTLCRDNCTKAFECHIFISLAERQFPVVDPKTWTVRIQEKGVPQLCCYHEFRHITQLNDMDRLLLTPKDGELRAAAVKYGIEDFGDMYGGNDGEYQNTFTGPFSEAAFTLLIFGWLRFTYIAGYWMLEAIKKIGGTFRLGNGELRFYQDLCRSLTDPSRP